MRGPIQTLLPLLLAAMIAAGCTDEGTLVPPLPPETYLFVGGDDLQATHYIQILSWHAEDRDSDRDSLHFQYRWTLDPSVTAPDFPTDWIGVERPYIYATSDTFYLPVPTSTSATVTHGFEIRAVDAEGNVDPTPAAASFPVFNQAPRLLAVSGGDTSSVLRLPATTLPVLSLQFRVLDGDNRDPENQSAFIREIRLWFEDPADFISIAGGDTLLTLRPEHFGSRVGQKVEINLQAVDLAGAWSNVLSDSTFVRDITAAKVLVLDSAGPLSASVSIVDPFWRDETSGIASYFAPGEFLIHDVNAQGAIGHPDNLGLIFSLFEAVIWYNGGAGAADNSSTSRPTVEISAAEAGIVSYLEAGGKVLLTGYNLIGASASPISGGSLSAGFETEVLLTDSLFVHSSGTPEFANSSNWRIWPPNAEITGFPAVGTRTLQNATALRGVDRMSLNPAALGDGVIEELFRSERERVQPASLFDGAIGVRRHFDSGGELVLLTFPISLAGGYGNHKQQVLTFLENFGVTFPGAP